MTLVLSILHAISAVILIAVILLQSGKTPGLSGAITGGSTDTFMAKSGRSLDKRLAKVTKWVACGFAIVTIAINLWG